MRARTFSLALLGAAAIGLAMSQFGQWRQSPNAALSQAPASTSASAAAAKLRPHAWQNEAPKWQGETNEVDVEHEVALVPSEPSPPPSAPVAVRSMPTKIMSTPEHKTAVPSAPEPATTPTRAMAFVDLEAPKAIPDAISIPIARPDPPPPPPVSAPAPTETVIIRGQRKAAPRTLDTIDQNARGNRVTISLPASHAR